MRRIHAMLSEFVTWCGLTSGQFGLSDKSADDDHAPTCEKCRKKRAQSKHGET